MKYSVKKYDNFQGNASEINNQMGYYMRLALWMWWEYFSVGTATLKWWFGHVQGWGGQTVKATHQLYYGDDDSIEPVVHSQWGQGQI